MQREREVHTPACSRHKRGKESLLETRMVSGVVNVDAKAGPAQQLLAADEARLSAAPWEFPFNHARYEHFVIHLVGRQVGTTYGDALLPLFTTAEVAGINNCLETADERFKGHRAAGKYGVFEHQAADNISN